MDAAMLYPTVWLIRQSRDVAEPPLADYKDSSSLELPGEIGMICGIVLILRTLKSSHNFCQA